LTVLTVVQFMFVAGQRHMSLRSHKTALFGAYWRLDSSLRRRQVVVVPAEQLSVSE
jgi:hypothetical protein